jgi:hypothetical protein
MAIFTPSPILLLRCYAFLQLLALSAHAHVEMSWPPPIGSKFDVALKVADINYDMASPLAADGSQFPCRKSSLQQPGVSLNSVATLTAGESSQITLQGTAIHGGGSCQISLSFDNGDTFKVVKSFIGGCPPSVGPVDLHYTLPDYVPAGEALLAWTWLNAIGNREFYMDCAVVTIESQTTDSSRFNSLPSIWVANQPEVNSCTTTEGDSPIFPDPGPDVEYGGGLSSASEGDYPADCEYKRVVADAANRASQPTSTAGPIAMAEIVSSSVEPLSDVDTFYPYSHVTSTHGIFSHTTIGVPCDVSDLPSTLTVTSVTVVYVCPSCTPTTFATVSSSARRRSSSTRSSRPSPPTPTPSGNVPKLPYADINNLGIYMPCVAGTFLCLDHDTFLTCDVTPSGGWSWQYPRKVAAGMMCLPRVEPMSGGMEQQPGAPAGFYRSDIYVRDRPFGDCSPDGSIGCRDGGMSWMVCDQGGWIDIGPVAAGTECVNGNIV